MIWVWVFWLGVAFLLAYCGLAIASEMEEVSPSDPYSREERPAAPYLWHIMFGCFLLGFAGVLSGGLAMTISVVTHGY